MLLGLRKTLYDHVTETLLKGPSDVSQIEIALKSKGIVPTVQGIYKALRELISEDIVVKQKTMYSVNSIWRYSLTKLVSQAPTFKLSPGERVTYRFNNIENTDAFWKHTFQDIQEETDSIPVFHFMPHQFWLLIPSRSQSEYEYYKRYDNKKIYDFNILGGTSVFDIKMKKDLTTTYNQISTDNKTNFNRRDHLSVIGPYIVTTRVSVNLARVTDRLYETCFTEVELAEKLQPVFKKSGTIILSVEHNEAKAKKLRRRMSSDFHIPREVREQFDLF